MKPVKSDPKRPQKKRDLEKERKAREAAKAAGPSYRRPVKAESKSKPTDKERAKLEAMYRARKKKAEAPRQSPAQRASGFTTDMKIKRSQQ
jgi:hypothetical protein